MTTLRVPYPQIRDEHRPFRRPIVVVRDHDGGDEDRRGWNEFGLSYEETLFFSRQLEAVRPSIYELSLVYAYRQTFPTIPRGPAQVRLGERIHITYVHRDHDPGDEDR